MLEEVERFLKERGFDYTLRYGNDNCYRITLRARAEIMRLLGSVRPQRLLADFRPEVLTARADAELAGPELSWP